MIIGIEGLPGAGKSTLAQRLHYPSVPEMLVTKKEEAGFSETDYLDHDVRKYKFAQSLGRRGMCIMDRTTLSFHAYRFAIGEIGESTLPIDTGEDIKYIYLNVSPEISLARQLSGLWVPSLDFLQRAAHFYQIQFEDSPSLVASIDASRPAEVVEDDVKQILLSIEPVS